MLSQLGRLKHVKTKFVDSALWQEGVLQRVDKVNLKAYLRAELDKVAASLQKMRAEVDEHRINADKHDVDAGVFDGDVVTLQLQLRNVIECIKVGKASVSLRLTVPGLARPGGEELIGVFTL